MILSDEQTDKWTNGRTTGLRDLDNFPLSSLETLYIGLDRNQGRVKIRNEKERRVEWGEGGLGASHILNICLLTMKYW